MSKPSKRNLNETELRARSFGGIRRAQTLSAKARKKIAQLGGQAKAKHAQKRKALSATRRAAALARWQKSDNQ